MKNHGPVGVTAAERRLDYAKRQRDKLRNGEPVNFTETQHALGLTFHMPVPREITDVAEAKQFVQRHQLAWLEQTAIPKLTADCSAAVA